MRPTPRCWAAELRLGPTGGDREVLGSGPCGRAGPRCLVLREQVPGAYGILREAGRGAPRFGEPPVGLCPQRPGASARGSCRGSSGLRPSGALRWAWRKRAAVWVFRLRSEVLYRRHGELARVCRTTTPSVADFGPRPKVQSLCRFGWESPREQRAPRRGNTARCNGFCGGARPRGRAREGNEREAHGDMGGTGEEDAGNGEGARSGGDARRLPQREKLRRAERHRGRLPDDSRGSRGRRKRGEPQDRCRLQ